MGVFDFLSGKSLEERALAFNRDNGGIIPDYGRRQVAPRTSGLILTFFEKHPAWRQLPKDLLEELSLRVADRSRNWVVYDPLHALEVLVLAEYRYSVLKKNFLPLCDDPSPVMKAPEARLHLFSMTFSKLANECARALAEAEGRGYPDDMIKDRLEDAKACAEASLICDRYYLPSFIPCAWGWALKDSDIDKSIKILEEGAVWGKEMATAAPHKISLFDQEMINDADAYINDIEQTKLEIMKLR